MENQMMKFLCALGIFCLCLFLAVICFKIASFGIVIFENDFGLTPIKIDIYQFSFYLICCIFSLFLTVSGVIGILFFIILAFYSFSRIFNKIEIPQKPI